MRRWRQLQADVARAALHDQLRGGASVALGLRQQPHATARYARDVDDTLVVREPATRVEVTPLLLPQHAHPRALQRFLVAARDRDAERAIAFGLHHVRRRSARGLRALPRALPGVTAQTK
jgi:hypothetical protein